MCKITVIQKLEAAKKQHILIPTIWETVDITDETAEPSIHNIAGMPAHITWTHHGTYKNEDVLSSSSNLRLTKSPSGEIMLLKS
jgi:hypothetical protein